VTKQIVEKGYITDERIATLFRNCEKILPAFFFPPHLVKFEDVGDSKWRVDFTAIESMLNYSSFDDLLHDKLMELTKRIPEIIVCAANILHYTDTTYMVVGPRHWSRPMTEQSVVIRELRKLQGKSEDKWYYDDEGFVNQYNVFRSRKQAAEVIKLHDQKILDRAIKDKHLWWPELFSEALY
jgi:hypothetical protein